MRSIDPTKPILVTGAGGYIAGWIVRYLLEAGLTVRATVRNTARRDKMIHLTRLAASLPGNLRLFAADLLTPGDFEDAMLGCELVIHTASPFTLGRTADPQAAFIRPAVNGTRNVLSAVNAVETVKRVVLTSSVVAMVGDNADMAAIAGDAFTEDHWNTTSSPSHQPYNYAKTVAERTAWEICRAQERWDLVVLNPAAVFGPSLTKMTASGSVGLMKQFGDGTTKYGVPDLTLGMVDVREVARAHVNAGFMPEAGGRHILAAGEIQLIEIGRILRERFGDRYPFPTRIAPKSVIWLIAPLLNITRPFVARNVGHPLRLDNTKSVKTLGITYRSKAESIVDHFHQLLDDGLVDRQ